MCALFVGECELFVTERLEEWFVGCGVGFDLLGNSGVDLIDTGAEFVDCSFDKVVGVFLDMGTRAFDGFCCL